MSANAGGSKGTDAEEYAVLMIAAVVGALVIWFVAWKYFVGYAVLLARAELWLLAPLLWWSDSYSHWANAVNTVLPKIKTFSHFWTFLSVAGQWIRWHTIILALAAGYYIIKTNKVEKYRKRWSLEDLIAYNATIWPRVFVALKIGKKLDPNDPLRRRPMHPHEWAFAQKALKIGVTKDRQGADVYDKENGTFYPERAYAAFVDQLGPAWAGFDALPFHTRVVAAVCCARIMEKPGDAATIFDAVGAAVRWTPEQPKKVDFVVSNEMMAHINSILLVASKDKEVLDIASRHHFVHGVMVALMIRARRQYGRLATSDFRWLKLCDRALFLTLNQEGRKTRWTEAAGIAAHFEMELLAKKPLQIPAVVMAVTALHQSLWNDNWCDNTHAQMRRDPRGVDLGENIRVFRAAEPMFADVRRGAIPDSELILNVGNSVKS